MYFIDMYITGIFPTISMFQNLDIDMHGVLKDIYGIKISYWLVFAEARNERRQRAESSRERMGRHV